MLDGIGNVLIAVCPAVTLSISTIEAAVFPPEALVTNKARFPTVNGRITVPVAETKELTTPPPDNVIFSVNVPAFVDFNRI